MVVKDLLFVDDVVVALLGIAGDCGAGNGEFYCEA